MPDKIRQDPSHEPSPDPITFDDGVIWGLDPAIHWVERSFQREQFPEIVLHIEKNWDNQEWLEKLVRRLGYSVEDYSADLNPKSLFRSTYLRNRGGIKSLRFFLLRAAGVDGGIIQNMFNAAYQSSGFPPGVYEDMQKKRRELLKAAKRK